VFDKLVVARVPFAIVLDVGVEAATPDVLKGGSLRVVLEMGAVVVQAAGVALSDAKVGDSLRVSITPTGKAVRAVLIGPTLAKVTGT
jgi:flagella basal body P-ring formation protein FlgA